MLFKDTYWAFYNCLYLWRALAPSPLRLGHLLLSVAIPVIMSPLELNTVSYLASSVALNFWGYFTLCFVLSAIFHCPMRDNGRGGHNILTPPSSSFLFLCRYCFYCCCCCRCLWRPSAPHWRCALLLLFFLKDFPLAFD